MKKKMIIVMCMLMVVLLCGCGEKKKDKVEKEVENKAEEDGKKTISLVTDYGNIDDKSFNEGSWNGVLKFTEGKDNYNRNYYRALFDSDEERKRAIEQAVDEGADILICPGSQFKEVIYDIQGKEEYKDKVIMLLDTEPTDSEGKVNIASNVHCILYKEEEVGYLAGYAAVKEGYRKLGFLGGMEFDPIKRFGYGYIQGAEAAAKELKLKEKSVEVKFWYGGGFQPTKKVTKKMRDWYKSGTEVIFSCGGGILYSVIEAAGDNKDRKIIGVDSDQADESDHIIFSAMKGLTESVYNALEELNKNDGKWPEEYAGKTAHVGVVENSVSLSATKDSWRMKNFTIDDYNKAYEKIKNGKLDIKDLELPKLEYVDYQFIK